VDVAICAVLRLCCDTADAAEKAVKVVFWTACHAKYGLWGICEGGERWRRR